MTHQPLDLPTVDFADGDLWHLGTLNPADKGKHYRQSYEGAGLSISQHPDDWAAIAKLGGLPRWHCHRPGHRFVDRWALTTDQQAALAAWAEAAGLVEPRPVWEAVWYDDELGDDLTCYYLSSEEADHEHPDGDAIITPIVVPAATIRLAQRTRTDPGEVAGAIDLALTIYVEDHTSHDGVWWEDDWDPLAYSCPRGVIVPSRIAQWTFCAD